MTHSGYGYGYGGDGGGEGYCDVGYGGSNCDGSGDGMDDSSDQPPEVRI
jgi:hypothetical protein